MTIFSSRPPLGSFLSPFYLYETLQTNIGMLILYYFRYIPTYIIYYKLKRLNRFICIVIDDFRSLILLSDSFLYLFELCEALEPNHLESVFLYYFCYISIYITYWWSWSIWMTLCLHHYWWFSFFDHLSASFLSFFSFLTP